MARHRKRLLVALAAVLLTGGAWGFTLQGPLAPWMTPRLGYDLNSATYGGPMIPGEEYRQTVPVLYYGFTPSFMNYFGNKGASEIDKAFKMLNDLPAASKLDLKSFGLSSMRMNQRAAALGIQDIKSVALGLAVEQMGLADPTRYVFTLRSRWTTTQPDTTNYYVIRRNYDPDTWLPSPYINGVLWTYPLVFDVDASHSLCYTEPVDPLAYLGLNTAPVTSWWTWLLAGGYYTRLTRDDVGGLYFLYRPDNYNLESLAPAVASGAGGGPWGPPLGGTNATGTNVVVTTNQLVVTAMRGGRDKITFKRVDFDGLLGTFTPFTNYYEDTFYTNGFEVTQYLERPLVAPDILFDAGDLQGGDGDDAIVAFENLSTAWIPAANTNGGGGLKLGPGIIPPADAAGPSFVVTFNNVGEILWNTYPVDNLDEATASIIRFWGSFDGSTNAPVVYPVGRDVRDVEAAVLEREGAGVAWGPP